MPLASNACTQFPDSANLIAQKKCTLNLYLLELLMKRFASVNSIFPYQSPLEKASLAFPCSLNQQSFFYQTFLRLVGVKEVNYWLAVDDDSQKILGTTELYSYQKEDEVYWLGWTCVAPAARGQGIGGRLVDFSIQTARNAGRNFLRLYTSNNPDIALAQILYEKRGFRIIGETNMWPNKFKKIYYELKL